MVRAPADPPPRRPEVDVIRFEQERRPDGTFRHRAVKFVIELTRRAVRWRP